MDNCKRELYRHAEFARNRYHDGKHRARAGTNYASELKVETSKNGRGAFFLKQRRCRATTMQLFKKEGVVAVRQCFFLKRCAVVLVRRYLFFILEAVVAIRHSSFLKSWAVVLLRRYSFLKSCIIVPVWHGVPHFSIVPLLHFSLSTFQHSPEISDYQ